MNKNQISYQVGRALINLPDVTFLSVAAVMGYRSVNHFAESEILPGIVSGAMSLYAGVKGLKNGSIRMLSIRDLKKINSDKKSYPLEHAEKLVIDDSLGLEFLLTETRSYCAKEWGTFLKVYHDKQRAVVSDVLDLSAAKEHGLIGPATISSIRLDIIAAGEEGYNGHQHYHPTGGAQNFTIGISDRLNPLNWINLLTFNLPQGPEIIGYNAQFVYIPTDSSKRELVKSSPTQIMKYLSR